MEKSKTNDQTARSIEELSASFICELMMENQAVIEVIKQLYALNFSRPKANLE